MSVVLATRSGVFADSFVSRSSAAPGFYAAKVIKTTGGVCAGCAGSNTAAQSFLKKLQAGLDPAVITGDDADFEALVLLPSKELLLYLGVCEPQPLTGKFFAVGTGAAFALGALSVGASPKDAIKVACRYDPACKLPFQQVFLA